jgi:cellulase/cellobiase CelA1
MVNATYSDGNSSDITNQGGKMERNYKDDGFFNKDEQTGDQRKWTI